MRWADSNLRSSSERTKTTSTGAVHDNTSKFELRSLLEHIHTRSWKGSGVHNVAEEYKIEVERMVRRQHLFSPSH